MVAEWLQSGCRVVAEWLQSGERRAAFLLFNIPLPSAAHHFFLTSMTPSADIIIAFNFLNKKRSGTVVLTNVKFDLTIIYTERALKEPPKSHR